MEGPFDVLEAAVYLLEDDIAECWVVNAHDVKNVPGWANTDRLDAVKLAEQEMLRPAFVPPAWQRELRDLCRYRRTLIRERTREKQRPKAAVRGKFSEPALRR
jgi:transposase